MGWTKKNLEHLYWKEKLSCIEIAGLIGCTESNVRYYMRKFKIPRRIKSEATKTKDKKREYSINILNGTDETFRFLTIINPTIKRGVQK